MCDPGAFIRKWGPKEVVKPECFYAKFKEEWRVMEKLDRDGLSAVKWEKAKPVCWDFLGSSIFWDNEAPFLWEWGGQLCHERPT